MRRAPALLLVAALAAPAYADQCEDLFDEAERIGRLRDADSAAGIEAARAGIDRATALGCDAARAEMYASLADNLNVAGRREESLAAYARAVALLAADGDSIQLAGILRREAITQASAGDYTAAVESALESYRIAAALGDANEAAMSAGNLGTLYSRLFDFDRARGYFERAHEAFVEAGNRVSAAGTGVNLGSLLMRQADRLVAEGDTAAARTLREDALRHNLGAVEQFEAIDHARGLSMALANAGVALNLLGRDEEALPLHRRALVIRERVGDHDGLTAGHIHLAQSYIPLGQFADAERHLTIASDLAADRNATLRLGVAEKWVELEEARGRAAEALVRMREVNRIRAEMTAADHQARVAEIRARFDTAEQAREIDRLRFEGEISDLRLERQRAWIVGAIVLVAFLVLAIGALLAWQRLSRRHVRALEHAARTDELTGLANRRGVRERIEYEIVRSRRSGRPFALAVIDIDGFKAINDRYGHEGGDRVLVEVAQRIARELRRQDTLARWGGDELLLLLPETDEAGASVLAHKLAAAIARAPVQIEGGLHAVTLTIGIAQYWPGQTLDECVRAADAAMYRGKKTGKAKVVTSRDEGIQGIPDS